MIRIWAIARKEFLHVLRDPRSLTVAILMPIMMIILYGYAIDMEMKNLRVAVMDLDQSAQSRSFVNDMISSKFIAASYGVSSRAEIEQSFKRAEYHAVLVIPAGYAESLASNTITTIQLLIDGADGTTAAVVDNYLNALVGRANRELAVETIGDNRPPIESRTRVLFNPELVSAHFVVPGLVAVVLIMICALLTSIAIAREKETGTMEQMLTSPVHPAQIIVGKVIPYLVIAAVDATIILMIGRLVFHVPMFGSWLVLGVYSLLYLAVALSIGLLISSVVDTQQVAMMLALMATMLPTLMLSGFIFPISSMPAPLQVVSQFIPATHYLQIIRGVMLKGESWFPLQAGVLCVMTAILLLMAIRKFKTRLE